MDFIYSEEMFNNLRGKLYIFFKAASALGLLFMPLILISQALLYGGLLTATGLFFCFWGLLLGYLWHKGYDINIIYDTILEWVPETLNIYFKRIAYYFLCQGRNRHSKLYLISFLFIVLARAVCVYKAAFPLELLPIGAYIIILINFTLFLGRFSVNMGIAAARHAVESTAARPKALLLMGPESSESGETGAKPPLPGDGNPRGSWRRGPFFFGGTHQHHHTHNHQIYEQAPIATRNMVRLTSASCITGVVCVGLTGACAYYAYQSYHEARETNRINSAALATQQAATAAQQAATAAQQAATAAQQAATASSLAATAAQEATARLEERSLDQNDVAAGRITQEAYNKKWQN